jgi:hypothetical protein
VQLFAGPGYAFVSGDSNSDFSDDSFTFHWGGSFRWDLSKKTYLNFSARWRYFDDRNGDDTDFEPSVGIGWKFGG